ILRSMLFVPGNNARRVEKALGLDADAVILDLEDAVAAAEKPAARAAVVGALRAQRSGFAYVRINGLGTQWCYRDLVEIVQPGLDGILLPKVERAADLHTVAWLLGALERDRGIEPGTIDLMPIIESGAGLAAMPEIAGCGARHRRVVFGAA